VRRVPTFRDQLADLRASLLPYVGHGAGAFYPLVIRPALAWSLVPRPREKPRAGDGSRTGADRRRERIAMSSGGAPAPPAGLVEGSELDAIASEPLRRNGMGGLTAHGAKKVEDFCALIRQDRGLYGIWTVTLPPEACADLEAIPGGIQVFGAALRRRFGEALARACARESAAVRRPIAADWCFVIEPQATGRPHWHFVFRCKSRRGRPWLLGKGRLDRLIRNCMRVATGRNHRTAAAGNVQAIRSTPGRYLSSYLKKEASRNAALLLLAHGHSENLIPRQWWGMSRSALALVESHRFELPSVLVGWLSRQWPGLVGIGVIDARLWTPEAKGAPAMVVGSWRSMGDARRCIEHLAALVERATPTGIRFGRT
jgi:hypothetical protein